MIYGLVKEVPLAGYRLPPQLSLFFAEKMYKNKKRWANPPSMYAGRITIPLSDKNLSYSSKSFDRGVCAWVLPFPELCTRTSARLPSCVFAG